MLHTSTRTHAGKLFAMICNALQFDNLGQMSDKTKQFAKDDKFCQPGGPLDSAIAALLLLMAAIRNYMAGASDSFNSSRTELGGG